MENNTKNSPRERSILGHLAAPVALVRPSSLGELIHVAVRRAIEQAVEDELEVALGAPWYERGGERRGYRNGSRERTLAGPTGPVKLSLPRGVLFEAKATDSSREWRSELVPRYQRRMREVNEAVLATYLAGGNTRQLKEPCDHS